MAIGQVTHIEVLADDLKIFRVQLENKPVFKVGQFTTLGLKDESGKLIVRAYSIASAPSDKELEFAIALKKDGKLTPLLFNLSVGDSIFVGDKFVGHFSIVDHLDRNKIFISTGTGIAPFMSAIREIKSFPSKVCLINGCRFVNNLSYVSELRERENNDKNFIYCPITSREEYNGMMGHLDKIYQTDKFKDFATDLRPENTDICICGMQNMVYDQIQYWVSLGYTEYTAATKTGNIFAEKY
ncbi:MAG: ferredoxin--NADP reductase [Bacteroidales bacterium]|nr:ferredoxin--NADP reductase [Bacteroidales bacterium]